MSETEMEYSPGYINLAVKRGVIRDILGLRKAKVVYWPANGVFYSDIRKVFKQTPEEDKALVDYFSQWIVDDWTLMKKARVVAEKVNDLIAYRSDSQAWGKVEYWARAIETFQKRYDDCDGHAVLIVKVLRLLGARPWEVFVATGDVEHPDGRKGEGHAFAIVLDQRTLKYYPVEGSWYPKLAIRDMGRVALDENGRYSTFWWMTNDVESYSNKNWIKFVKPLRK